MSWCACLWPLEACLVSILEYPSQVRWVLFSLLRLQLTHFHQKLTHNLFPIGELPRENCQYWGKKKKSESILIHRSKGIKNESSWLHLPAQHQMLLWERRRSPETHMGWSEGQALESCGFTAPCLATNMAQAVRVAAGSICLVQKQWCLLSPVQQDSQWFLGRITATDHSDERHTGEKLGDTSPCSQTTSLRLRTIKGRSCATVFGSAHKPASL